MKNARVGLLSSTLAVGALALGGLLSPAAAAETLTVCASGCDHTTIQAAVDAAVDGDTVVVTDDLAVAGTTTIGKDVTVTGAPGVAVTQTANAITFLLSGDGATLSDLTITSDVAYAKEFVQIAGDDVTVSGTTIFGPDQPGPMSGWVTNRGFVPQGGVSGLTVTGNTIHSVRSGAYLNPGSSGTISDNTLDDTKGDFLIDDADFTFTGNRAGDPAQPSEWGFVIFAGTDADRYTDVPALSASNTHMTVWDQRDGETYVPPTTADQCKKGGYAAGNPSFANQGQCIRFVNTGR